MPAPVIIVTGVSRGIGRAIAEELQARGAAVVGAARNVADVPATASLLPVAADVTQETGRQAILEAALERHGRLDGLVNNVGTAFRRASVDTALEDFRQVLEVNLLATFALCCAAHPHLKASRGSVVNVSSVTGSRALPVRIAYGTSDIRRLGQPAKRAGRDQLLLEVAVLQDLLHHVRAREPGQHRVNAIPVPVTMMTGAGISASSVQVSSLRGCHLLRGPGAGVSNVTPLAPFVRGKCSSHHVLLQQVEGGGEKNHILHEESHVAFHRREAGGRVPAVRHERDDGDGSYHCKGATEGPESSRFLVPESPEQERGEQPFRSP